MSRENEPLMQQAPSTNSIGDIPVVSQIRNEPLLQQAPSTNSIGDIPVASQDFVPKTENQANDSSNGEQTNRQESNRQRAITATSSASYLPERNLARPTSNLLTFIHLLKANVGTGIQAMPDAFKNAGMAVGSAAVVLLGIICVHCMHMLVNCSHTLCFRTNSPSLDYAAVMAKAFETGPSRLRRFTRLAKRITQVFLCITQFGFCCVYIVYCSANFKQIFDCLLPSYVVPVYVYMTVLLPFFLGLGCIRDLKSLGPCSNIANAFTIVGLVLIFKYILVDLPDVREREAFSSWSQLPLFFGTAMYAFEGIGVVLPLENNMKHPEDFGGWTGVLNTGMVIVVCSYMATGFYGYLRYGDDVRGSITLNLPTGDHLVYVIQIVMSLAIFLTYGLQFYVPIRIIWPYIKSKIRDSTRHRRYEYMFRIGMVFLTYILAIIIPSIGLFISLVGAISSSLLAIVFPPLIETLTRWPDELGRGYWVLWKNLLIGLVGIFGAIAGTYTTLKELINFFSEGHHHHVAEC